VRNFIFGPRKIETWHRSTLLILKSSRLALISEYSYIKRIGYAPVSVAVKTILKDLLLNK